MEEGQGALHELFLLIMSHPEQRQHRFLNASHKYGELLLINFPVPLKYELHVFV